MALPLPRAAAVWTGSRVLAEEAEVALRGHVHVAPVLLEVLAARHRHLAALQGDLWGNVLEP